MKFELDGLLRGDAKTRAEIYTAALDPLTGWMTRDEVRRLEDLAPEPQGAAAGRAALERACRGRQPPMATEPKAPEQRTIDVDVKDIDTRGRTLHGYAAVYGAESGDLGGFRERIAPGAFAGVLDADVRALLNHDPNEVLRQDQSGTLRL